MLTIPIHRPPIHRQPWLYELGHYTRRHLLDTPHCHSSTDNDSLRRAWDLFIPYLTPDQRADLLTYGYFDTGVRVQRHAVFIIAIEAYINVCAGPHTWCTNPIGQVPLWDKILAQYLSIRSGDFFDYAAPWNDIPPPHRALDYLAGRW